MFNSTLDKVYADILEFEKENINKSELKIYKLKKIFEERYRQYFLHGDLIRWCMEKPLGYAGDFKIIDDIYRNQSATAGLTRLWDNWFLELSACRSVRERKEDFKKLILDFAQRHRNKDIRVMNLASGPAREIKELLEADVNGLFSKTTFDCYDFEMKAIEYARGILGGGFGNVNFFQKNALRLALEKAIEEDISYKYDLIYSSGLFDYLDERVAARLVGNLRKILKKDGIIIIATARDKYSNSSAAWMEWVVEWYLIYRTEDEFRRIFLDAGIRDGDLQIIVQKSRIMQYCLAK
jgi:SAM-dependent methyltransferase